MVSPRKRMVLPDSYAAAAFVFYFLTAALYLTLFCLAYNELIIKMKPFDLLSPLLQLPAFMFFSMSLISALISIYLFYALYSEDIDKIRVGIVMNSVIMGLTFVLTLIAFIIVFGESHPKKESRMYTALHKYHVDKKLVAGLDLLQSELKCCGIKSYVDWNKSRKYRCLTDSPVVLRCGVPRSCCRSENGPPSKTCGAHVLPFPRIFMTSKHTYHNNSKTAKSQAEKVIYTNGCSEKVKKLLRDAGIKLITYYVVLMFLEMLSLVFHIYSKKYLVKRNEFFETRSSVFYRELPSHYKELPSTCRPEAKPFRKLQPIPIPVERDMSNNGRTSNYISTFPHGSTVEKFESWRISPCQNVNPFEKSTLSSKPKRVKMSYPAVASNEVLNPNASSFDNTIYTLNVHTDGKTPKVHFKTKAPETHFRAVQSNGVHNPQTLCFDNAVYTSNWFTDSKKPKANLHIKAPETHFRALPSNGVHNPKVSSFDNAMYTSNRLTNGKTPKAHLKTKAHFSAVPSNGVYNPEVSSFDNTVYTLNKFADGKTPKSILKTKASKAHFKAATPEEKFKVKTPEAHNKDKKPKPKRSAKKVDEVELCEAGPSWKLTPAETQMQCVYGL